MSQKQTTEKKNSQVLSLPLVAVFMAALVGYMVIFATPVIGEFPVEITEELEILAVSYPASPAAASPRCDADADAKILDKVFLPDTTCFLE